MKNNTGNSETSISGNKAANNYNTNNPLNQIERDISVDSNSILTWQIRYSI